MGLGLGVSEAVARALGRTLTAFGEDHGWSQPQVSQCLNAHRPYPDIRDAICAELDIPRPYLDRLIDSQRPAENTASDPAA